MASSDILSQTLSSITSIKLAEISNQRESFEKAKSELLDKVECTTDQSLKVDTLLSLHDGNLPGLGSLDTNTVTDLENIRKFWRQAKLDPSISSAIQQGWQSKLEKQLDIQSLKYEYASLYGQLVNEWLSANVDKEDTDSDSSQGSFENVGRKEMHDQRQKWEKMVFTAQDTDTKAFEQYLTTLFNSSKDITAAYCTLCYETRLFERSMETDVHFNQKSLRWVIKGLLRSDLVSDEKRKVLKDFSNNEVVLDEIADVLNMRIKSLDTWKWDPAGTVVEQRRQLNGRYRFYHDEDLLQTILLHYIGVKWSVFFQNAFVEFQHTASVWKSSATKMAPTDRERREFFLAPHHAVRGVETRRATHFRDEIFMEHLQKRIDEERGTYANDREEEDDDNRKSSREITQTLLHSLAAEIIMKTRLGEDMTVVRTDFAWFGPSLPHSTMFTVLKFFSVSTRWVDFFRRSIEAPIKFQDGPNPTVRIRKCGTPISGPLSDVLAETVLFCLDFAFNQESNGTLLYRLHDDIWFWGTSEKCVKGWDIMRKFANLAGLEFAKEKTGSVCISSDRSSSKISASVQPSLPKGDVRWGFLKLDAKSGRFVIDQDSVDKHIVELRLQLAACNSVFDWIHAWNIYGARFFSTNFGKPANSFGLAHVDMLLETFARIQARLFANTGGSVTSTLKQMLTDRFGVTDIPEGYLYFPISMGGLELKSPFVDLYLIRGMICTRPDVYMDNFFVSEDTAYQVEKKAFEAGTYRYSNSTDYALKKKYGDEDFLSMEEYTRYRELTSEPLATAYDQLTKEPEVEDIKATLDVQGATSQNWKSLSPYQQWVIQLYSPEIISRFGGLNVVEKGLLPTGMVTMFREARFKWKG